ncbi:MAG: ATPase domain-containing protein [Limisphaerales bacterium]
MSPLQTLIETSALTYERYLLTALARSIRFYRTHRANLCPINPATGRYRQDFSTNRFNLIYKAIVMFWCCYDIVPVTADMEIPQLHLEALIIDAANRGEIPSDVAQEILNDIKLDLYAGPPPNPAFLEAMGGAAFTYWLNLRVASQTVNKLNAQAAASSTTLDDLAATVTKAKMQLPGSTNTIVTGQAALHGSRLIKGAIKTGLPDLDAALGGGLNWGQSTMIAGVNGGCKTLFTVQLAGAGLCARRNVVFISTEEPMDRIIQRLVMNQCHIPADLINVVPQVDMSDRIGVLAKTIAPELWASPIYGPRLQALEALLDKHLWLVNWTDSSRSVVGNFDSEIEKLRAVGCEPEMILFDWIGGALEQDRNVERRRLLFEESANHLINFGKQNNAVMVMVAQLDKVKTVGKARPTMAMLSECKTMTNNIHNFIGISSLLEANRTIAEGGSRLQPRQFLNVDKARYGKAGAVQVLLRLDEQRIVAAPAVLAGGG